MKEYKFLLIGCGRIAQRHALYIQQVGKLVAVCDIEKNKAAAFVKHNAVKWYVDHQQMLKDNSNADIVVVCTPNGLHSLHSIDALNAGFHVLCEKPMAIHTSDVALMLAAAEKSKKQLFIVKQNRFNPPVQAVKKLLTENRLGKIYSVQLTCLWNRPKEYYNDSWRGIKELDGGTLFTQFSHFIDLINWYFGNVRVIAAVVQNAAHNNSIEFEDEGAVLLKLGDDILGTLNYSVNTWKKNIEGSLIIVGEKGTVKIGGEYLNKLEYQCIDNYTIGDLPLGNLPNDYGTYQGSMSNHKAVYENLVAVLNNPVMIATNSHEAGETVAIIENIYNKAIYS